MKTHDEAALERFVDVSIVIPPLLREKWRFFFEKVISEALLSNSPNPFHSEKYHLEELQKIQTTEEWRECCDALESILNTPRKLKIVGRHLKQKIQTPAKNLFLYDLILLSSILAFNPMLFDWVQNNRRLLIDKRSMALEDSLALGFDNESEESKRKNTIDIVETSFGRPAVQLINILFFNDLPHKKSLELPGPQNRNVRNSPYFLTYFIRDTLPFVESIEGYQTVQFAARRKDSTDAIAEIYTIILKDWQENAREDLRNLIVENLSLRISELEPYASYNCLIALGKLAKVMDNDPMFGHKRSAVMAVWRFLKTKPKKARRAYEFIIKILNSDVSHAMYTALIFYLFTKDAERRETIPELDIYIDDIRVIFAKRCREIFYNPNGNPQNLLDPLITDSPIEMMFRWAQVQEVRSHSRYLVKFIRMYAFEASHFIEEVRKGSHDQRSVEVLLTREDWGIFLEPDIEYYLSSEDRTFVRLVLSGKFSDGLFD